MGQFPLFMSPTASVNVTYALGVSSFVYYNYVGISENGLFNIKAFCRAEIAVDDGSVYYAPDIRDRAY